MGYSNPDSGCRRHPNQRQLPGICSFCLRERLSKLSSENNSYKTSNSTFSEEESESETESSSHRFSNHRHRRNGSDVPGAPVGFVLHQGSTNGSAHGHGDVTGKMKKSRSVAWAPRSLRGGGGGGNGRIINEQEEDKGKAGKKGLWKKLIHSTSKKTKGVLMHSLTVRERSRDNNSPRVI